MIIESDSFNKQLQQDKELCQLTSLVPTISIILYDGLDIRPLEDLLDFIRSCGGLKNIVSILLIGEDCSQLKENKAGLQKQIEDGVVASVTKRQFVKETIKSPLASLVFHIANERNARGGFFPKFEHIDDYVRDSRSIYAVSIKVEKYNLFGTPEKYTIEKHLSLNTLPKRVKQHVTPHKETSFCQERKAMWEKYEAKGEMSQESIFFQCVGDVEHGCETCSMCDNYDDTQKKCPMAQRNVARFYRQRIFVPRNERIAHQWEIMAARQGYKDAIVQTAEDYAIGIGCTKDINKAVSIYEQLLKEYRDKESLGKIIELCESENIVKSLIVVPYLAQLASEGELEAISLLEQAFQEGKYGLPKDAEQQKYWLEQGAQKGAVRLVFKMAQMLEAQSKWSDAYQWYKKLYEIDPKLIDPKKLDEIEILMMTSATSVEDVANVGMFKLFGLFGHDYNLKLAFKYLSYASKHKSALATGLLGRMYYEGLYVDTYERKGVELLKDASRNNDLRSLEMLYVIYTKNNDVDSKEALSPIFKEQIEIGCKNGLAYAHYLMGMFSMTGCLVKLCADTAFNSMNRAARLNEPAAKYALSKMYLRGYGCEVNSTLSNKWLEEAANDGYYKAQGDYAIQKSNPLYFFRNESSENLFKMLRNAKTQGYDKVNWCLGNAYILGRGTEKDLAKGYALLTEAAESGDIKAQEKLCQDYFRGNDYLPIDYNLCAKWGQLAMNKGNKTIRFETAYSYAEIGKNSQAQEIYLELANEGSGLAMNNYACGLDDPEEKTEWFKKAADAGNNYGYWNLGRRYKNGYGTEKDIDKAIECFKTAAGKGQTDAMQELAIIYRDGDGVEQNAEEAVYWFEKASEAGKTDAMISLGHLYNQGTIINSDIDTASHYYKMAAEKGNVSALYWLGTLYEADRENAVYWYRKAAEKGDVCAKKALIRLGTNWTEDGKIVDKIYEETVDDDLPD